VITLDMRTMRGPVADGSAWDAPGPAWDAPARDTAHTLPEGTRFFDYEIVGPIGEGGFGIVYLAWDRARERHVAIKEYLPAVLASRASASPGVVVKSQRHSDSFRIGMRSFVNEARILARFDHPALVRVLHFWESNGTAYMAMPYYAGPTLARALAELGRPPDEAELLAWLRPLLDALATMHALSCFHRDIAPDNILLTDSGPVLLDFGAARRVIDGMEASPAAEFKPGFAPIEQCGGDGASMKQGAWTDLYALAGVVYMAVTGRPPTPSVERLRGTPLLPLSELARGRYSARFLAAIDAAMALHPRNRPQSVAEFWTQLSGAGMQPAHAVPSPAKRRGNRSKAPALAATVLLVGLAVAGYHRFGDAIRAVPQAALVALPASPLPASFAPASPLPPKPATAEAPPRAAAALPAAPLDAEEEPSDPADAVLRALALPPAPKTEARVAAEKARAARREARAAALEQAPRPAAARTARAEAAPEHNNRCTEMLQRASLEPLSSAEAALLRRDCE
jgi:serine/threonine protein kinase